MMNLNLSTIRCIVFDFGFTLSSDLYFKIAPPSYPLPVRLNFKGICELEKE